LEELAMRHLTCILICLLLIYPVRLIGQRGEISITSSSEEAREMFIAGRLKKENIENAAADNLFNMAIELDPEFALAYLYRGRAQDYEAANDLIDNVTEGEKLVILYFTALNADMLKESKSYLDKLLSNYPSDKHVHLWAGLFYENILQNYRLALDHFYIASRLDETYAPPLNEIGYRHMRLGEYNKSEEAFRNYINLAPECPNAFDSYANFLMRLGRYDESIEQYLEAYDLNPDNSVTLARIGQNYAFMGDFKEARRYYQKYNRQSDQPGQKLAALTLCAAASIAEGKIDDAMKSLDDYRDIALKNDLNLNMIMSKEYQGWIQLEFGDVQRSLIEYEEAVNMISSLELSESTRKAYNFHAFGWRCLSYTANNKFAEAEAELEKARELMEASENPILGRAYHSYAGYLELGRGNYDKAIEHFTLCGGDDAYIVYKLAYSYEKAGETEEAQNLYDNLDSWENFGLNYAFARSLIDKDK